MGASTEAGYFNRLIFTSIEMGASASIPFRVFENPIIYVTDGFLHKIVQRKPASVNVHFGFKTFLHYSMAFSKNSPLQLLFRVDKRILLLSKHVGAVQLSIVYSR